MVSSDSSCHCHCCNSPSRMCCSDCILVLLALLFPPLPVWIKCGICSAESFINMALSILGFLPGVIHSFYIIAKYPIKYVVLDEESQTYRPVNFRRERVVRVERVDRIQTPSQEQVMNNAHYGSTSGAPPAYSELDQTAASSSSGPVVQATDPTPNDRKNTR